MVWHNFFLGFFLASYDYLEAGKSLALYGVQRTPVDTQRVFAVEIGNGDDVL